MKLYWGTHKQHQQEYHVRLPKEQLNKEPEGKKTTEIPISTIPGTPDPSSISRDMNIFHHA